MWDLASPGIEPMSPALAGGFFTSEPPGKFKIFFLTLVCSNLEQCKKKNVDEMVDEMQMKFFFFNPSITVFLGKNHPWMLNH